MTIMYIVHHIFLFPMNNTCKNNIGSRKIPKAVHENCSLRRYVVLFCFIWDQPFCVVESSADSEHQRKAFTCMQDTNAAQTNHAVFNYDYIWLTENPVQLMMTMNLIRAFKIIYYIILYNIIYMRTGFANVPQGSANYRLLDLQTCGSSRGYSLQSIPDIFLNTTNIPEYSSEHFLPSHISPCGLISNLHHCTPP